RSRIPASPASLWVGALGGLPASTGSPATTFYPSTLLPLTVVLVASATENADLFWGLRGGGGNFGVVTSFEYQLHPVGLVLAGMVLYPSKKAKEALMLYRDFVVRIGAH